MGDLGTLEMEGLKGSEDRGEELEDMEMGLPVLDFDLLCSTVALQTHKGKWTMLRTSEETEYSGEASGEHGAAFRMWEGELFDCLDDRRIAVQSTCCPCYRFGKNMKRAGFGSCLLQGALYFLLTAATILSFIGFLVAKRHTYLYIGIGLALSIGTYSGFFRWQIRKKFNIRGSDSLLDDCTIHVLCPCCSLFQESRTLEMNNVQKGVWHGRGDTICVGGYSSENKAGFHLHPPPTVAIKQDEGSSL